METNYSFNSLRTIALFQVILIHVFAYYSFRATETLFYIPILDHIVQSGVPIFIFLSGFALSSKYWDNFSIKTFYKKRFIRVWPPYLFYCFLYSILHPLINGMAIEFSLEDFINIFFDPWNFFYHFWYIALISSFYLFYPLLVKIFKRFKENLFIVLLVSILIQSVYRIVLPLINISLGSLSESFIIFKIIYWPLKYFFFSYIALFTLGVYVSKNLDKIILKHKFFYLSIIPVIIFTIISEFIMREHLEPFFSISIILFYLSFLINRRILFLEVISKYSYGIYLIHAIVLVCISRSLNLYFNYWFFYLYAFILTFSISFIIIYGLSKIPKSQGLIGVNRKN